MNKKTPNLWRNIKKKQQQQKSMWDPIKIQYKFYKIIEQLKSKVKHKKKINYLPKKTHSSQQVLRESEKKKKKKK